MDWYLLAILSVFTASLTGIFRKIIVNKNKHPIEAAILFQVIGTIIMGIFVFRNGFILPPIFEYPFNFALIGILWGSATIFLFKAYKYLGASEVAILSTLETITVLILGKFILNEKIDIQILIGIALIIIPIIFISLNNIKKIQFNKGLIFIFASSIFAAVAGINDVILLKQSEGFSYIFIAFLLPGIFIYLLNSIYNRKISINIKKINLKYISLLALFSVIANIPYYFAIKFDGQISQVLPINKTSIIFTILLSAIILKEKNNLYKKIFSGILVVIGVILLNK